HLPITTTTNPPITSTGGKLTYMIGNQLTWTGDAGTFKYAICAARPSDHDALHFIGYSYPYDGTDLPTHYSSSLTFTDWGEIMSGPPKGPWESPSEDSICKATHATNDYLATKIVSGAGTPTLTLEKSATQTIDGQLAKFTIGPALQEAAEAAVVARGTV